MKTIRYQGTEDQTGYPRRKPGGGIFRITGDRCNSQRLSAIQDEFQMDFAGMQPGSAIFYRTPEGVNIVRQHQRLPTTGDNGGSQIGKIGSLANSGGDDDLTA